MKLWLLTSLDGFSYGYDMAQGFVVRAETEADARMIAAKHGGDEQYKNYRLVLEGGWLDADNADCTELVPEGDAGLILRDFNAG